MGRGGGGGGASEAGPWDVRISIRSSPTRTVATARRTFLYRYISSKAPLMRRAPSVRGSLPTRTFRKVVLPAPDGPMMAVTRPGRMRPETSLKIVLFCGAGKVSVMFLKSRSSRMP
jgi:hypothetical protein